MDDHRGVAAVHRRRREDKHRCMFKNEYLVRRRDNKLLTLLRAQKRCTKESLFRLCEDEEGLQETAFQGADDETRRLLESWVVVTSADVQTLPSLSATMHTRVALPSRFSLFRWWTRRGMNLV